VNKEEIAKDLADSNAFVLYWNGELLGEKKKKNWLWRGGRNFHSRTQDNLLQNFTCISFIFNPPLQ